jgi:hypothetical protein
MESSRFISILVVTALAVAASCGAEPLRQRKDAGITTGAGGAGGAVTGGTGGAGLSGSGGELTDGAAGPDQNIGGGGGAQPPPPEPRPDAAAPDAPPSEVAADLPPMQLTFMNSCARVHWTASASHFATGDPPADAIDGRASTRWAAGKPQSGNEYLQVNFNGAVRINQIVLDNRSGNTGDYPRAYRLMVSNDGTTFTQALPPTTVPPNPGAAVTITLPWAEARSIRIMQTGSDPVAWWSVNEVRVNCQLVNAPPAGAIDPYEAANWKATASASLGGAGPSNAFDGDPASKWTTGQQQRSTDSFLLDLGAVTSVGLIVLDSSDAESPERYAVDTSTDGVDFTPAITGAGASPTRIQLTPRPARYIRIRQIGTRATPWAINEIVVSP